MTVVIGWGNVLETIMLQITSYVSDVVSSGANYVRRTHKKLFGALQFPKHYTPANYKLQQFLIGIFRFEFIYK